jgi:hypothetical protein
MRTYTNLAWPEDPYRTGQQLYRRPPPRLAAVTMNRAGDGSRRLACLSVAIVYLPLHRTKTLTVTGQTVAFGFHAASIAGTAEAPGLARLAGLDLLQARRHAAVLTGHMLGDDLTALRNLAGDLVPRGIVALEREWADRHDPASGKAAMLDCGLDLPGGAPLAEACQQARISVSTEAPALDAPAAGELTVIMAVHRALAIALVAARHLDRYTWEGTLHTHEILAAGAWDRLPLPTSQQPRQKQRPQPLARRVTLTTRNPK